MIGFGAHVPSDMQCGSTDGHEKETARELCEEIWRYAQSAWLASQGAVIDDPKHHFDSGRYAGFKAATEIIADAFGLEVWADGD